MAKKQKGPGIQSAAGLIRYFDAEEETAIKIPPAAVLVFSLIVGVGVVMLSVIWPYKV